MVVASRRLSALDRAVGLIDSPGITREEEDDSDDVGVAEELAAESELSEGGTEGSVSEEEGRGERRGRQPLLKKAECIRLGLCHVCRRETSHVTRHTSHVTRAFRQPGHQSGFVNAVYIDCPNKPCYLCKQVFTTRFRFANVHFVGALIHTSRRVTTQGIVRSENPLVVQARKRAAAGEGGGCCGSGC